MSLIHYSRALDNNGCTESESSHQTSANLDTIALYILSLSPLPQINNATILEYVTGLYLEPSLCLCSTMRTYTVPVAMPMRHNAQR